MQLRFSKRVVGVSTVVLAGGAMALAAMPTASAAGANSFLGDAGPANTKAAGTVRANGLAPGLREQIVASGAMPLTNGTSDIPFYGYRGDGTMVPAAGAFTEATKTEPDKNTYLVLGGQHYLFQGHEGGPGGYVTRINLDATVNQRVTLISNQDTAGKSLPTFDGSTWDPFAQRLLLTAESSSVGGVWQTPTAPGSRAESLQGVIGIGSYEGVQNDSAGNVWLVEDAGGTTINGAKLPNSFVYRFKPVDKTDLTKGGQLQALQVLSNASDRHPLTFASSTANSTSPLTPDVKELHTGGANFETQWVTIHDTATAGFSTFDANAAAKAAGATPFKRPENGVFRPGVNFKEFFFTETGDTSATSPANGSYGGWGSLMHLTQSDPSANFGTLSMFYAGNQEHTGLDNIAFLSRNVLTAVEDAGDGLHSQRNALDSAYTWDVTKSYQFRQPTRWLAEGRDASATIDSGLSDAKSANVPGAQSYQNEGDNEITGIHVSNGDPTVNGILGTKVPVPFVAGWRVFWTQQHGDNNTWEVLPG